MYNKNSNLTTDDLIDDWGKYQPSDKDIWEMSFALRKKAKNRAEQNRHAQRWLAYKRSIFYRHGPFDPINHDDVNDDGDLPKNYHGDETLARQLIEEMEERGEDYCMRPKSTVYEWIGRARTIHEERIPEMQSDVDWNNPKALENAGIPFDQRKFLYGIWSDVQREVLSGHESIFDVLGLTDLRWLAFMQFYEDEMTTFDMLMIASELLWSESNDLEYHERLRSYLIFKAWLPENQDAFVDALLLKWPAEDGSYTFSPFLQSIFQRDPWVLPLALPSQLITEFKDYMVNHPLNTGRNLDVVGPEYMESYMITETREGYDVVSGYASASFSDLLNLMIKRQEDKERN